MSNPYEELSDRAKWFMENFDECGVAEICASHEAAADKAQAAIDRARKAISNARYHGWSPSKTEREVLDALNPQDPATA